MKRVLLLSAVLLGFALSSLSQKPVLDSATTLQFGEWPSVDAPFISNDGKYVLYTLKGLPQVGTNTLVAQSTTTDWKRTFVGVERGVLSADSKRVIFKKSGDSICVVTLGTDKEDYLPNTRSFHLLESGMGEWLVYMKNEPAGELVMQSLATDKERKFAEVKDYAFDPKGMVLVWAEQNIADSGGPTVLHWEDLSSGKEKLIWIRGIAENYVFDYTGRQLAILSETKVGKQEKHSLWYYGVSKDSARLLVDDEHAGIDSNLSIDESLPEFSRDGNRIFFQLIEKPFSKASSEGVTVDVWNYKDLNLQSLQLQNIQFQKKYIAVVGIKDSQLIQLQRGDESLMIDHSGKNDQAIAYSENVLEGWWNIAAHGKVYRVNTVDGSRQLIRDRLSYRINPLEYSFSPDGRWILWFDRLSGSWNSFEVGNGITRNLSKRIPYKLYNETTVDYATHRMSEPVGVAGWLSDGRSVILYDDYDLWRLDAWDQRKPVNITKGYGRRHHLKLRVAWPEDRENRILSTNDTLLLSAFDCDTKFNGFYLKVLSAAGDPKRLFMGPYVLYAERTQLLQYSSARSEFLRKARDGADWILTRRSAEEASNLYTTRDFKTFRALSECEPQKLYNWLTTELVHWKLPGGKQGVGILYKPEDFDSTKKYPVIFNYYEQRSDNLNDYPAPYLSYGEINIPYYVSRGYLVFEPDIYYRTGYIGESVTNCLISAALYLSKRPYIDGRRVGLQGVSFGGFETNYLVTHTHLFAAAAEGCGESDIVSNYNGLKFGINGNGFSCQYYAETGQGRIGTTLWDQPDRYIANSPIFLADRVTTPLLMTHNKKDGTVFFGQAVELFTALRRLGKRVWLLQYDDGGHGVIGEMNQRDYTIRMRQFFDHYLKGLPAPLWMTEGIRASMKGLDSGLEVDTSSRVP